MEPPPAYATQWRPTLGDRPPQATPAAPATIAGIPKGPGLIGVALLVVVALVAAFVWPRFGGGHSAPRVLTAAGLEPAVMHAADFNEILGMPVVTDGPSLPDNNDSVDSPNRGPCGAPMSNPAPATAPSASGTVLSGSDTGIVGVVQVDPKLFDAFVAANRADMRDGCPEFDDTSDGDTSQVQFVGEVPLSLNKKQAVAYTTHVVDGDREFDITALFLRRGDVVAIFGWVGSSVLPEGTLASVARRMHTLLGKVH